MENEDIVDRLRKQEVGRYNALLWDEAADEIKRLRELVRNADEFRETITELRQRVETLTAERDEARREACRRAYRDSMIDPEGREYAADRGWDCFEEDGK